jgi:hypothetical protein
LLQNNKKWFIKTWVRIYFGNQLQPFENVFGKSRIISMVTKAT